MFFSKLLGFLGQFFLVFLGGFHLGGETIDATLGVDDFFLAGKERVRRTRNVDFYQWIFVAVLPNNGFIGGDGRFREEGKLGGLVQENNQTIICGM